MEIQTSQEGPREGVDSQRLLHFPGSEQQRKNPQPAPLSPCPRRSPVGVLGTSAPGSSRLATVDLGGVAGLGACVHISISSLPSLPSAAI